MTTPILIPDATRTAPGDDTPACDRADTGDRSTPTVHAPTAAAEARR